MNSSLTSNNDDTEPDFAVLWPDGRIDYHHTDDRTGGRPIHHAI